MEGAASLHFLELPVNSPEAAGSEASFCRAGLTDVLRDDTFRPMVTAGRVAQMRADAGAELPRKLGFFDALSIVVGIIIGAGIFLVPNLVARELQSPV